MSLQDSDTFIAQGPPQSSLPYLTPDIPGIGGEIKSKPEDFIVEEIPLYEPSGQGDHVYALIEKRGISSLDLFARLSRWLSIPRKQIGYAGLKDARAVTRQWVSVEHVDPEMVAALDIPRMEVLRVERHTNKLKVGHLKGNRFTLRIRRPNMPVDQALEHIGPILERIQQRGVPNYFGPQRFGVRHDAQKMGAAIINGQYEHFIDLMLGHPMDCDMPPIREARQAYHHQDYATAAKAWPRNFNEQRQALQTIIRKNGDKLAAYSVLDRRFKRFYISAFQSDLFNMVVEARMPNIDQVMDGDVAWLHTNGACFLVADAAAEQPRCLDWQISATGPLFGARMLEPQGQPAEIERAVYAHTGLVEDHFQNMDVYQTRGTRRAIRFQPRQVECSTGSDQYSEYLELQFELDSGCYATTFVREITKTPDLL